MPRIPRVAPGGQVYHVINRAAGRRRIFGSASDYVAFERCLALAGELVPGCRVLAWAVMPNHWHLVLWPRRAGELTAFMRKLTLTHAVRWNTAHKRVGEGPVYQGRFKSFIVKDDLHLPWVMRYVLRNPVRAGLVERAGDWPWSSWGQGAGRNGGRGGVGGGERPELSKLVAAPPVALPADFAARLDQPETSAELEAVRRAVSRSSPFGPTEWAVRTAKRLDLETTLRPRGRPRKPVEGGEK